MVSPGVAVMDSGQVMLQKGTMMGGGASSGPFGNGPFDHWGDPGLISGHGQTDMSTDTDDRNQVLFHFFFPPHTTLILVACGRLNLFLFVLILYMF